MVSWQTHPPATKILIQLALRGGRGGVGGGALHWQGREVCFGGGDGPRLGEASKQSSGAACGLHQWRRLSTARESDINIFEEAQTGMWVRASSPGFINVLSRLCHWWIVCVPSRELTLYMFERKLSAGEAGFWRIRSSIYTQPLGNMAREEKKWCPDPMFHLRVLCYQFRGWR